MKKRMMETGKCSPPAESTVPSRHAPNGRIAAASGPHPVSEAELKHSRSDWSAAVMGLQPIRWGRYDFLARRAEVNAR